MQVPAVQDGTSGWDHEVIPTSPHVLTPWADSATAYVAQLCPRRESIHNTVGKVRSFLKTQI